MHAGAALSMVTDQHLHRIRDLLPAKRLQGRPWHTRAMGRERPVHAEDRLGAEPALQERVWELSPDRSTSRYSHAYPSRSRSSPGRYAGSPWGML